MSWSLADLYYVYTYPRHHRQQTAHEQCVLQPAGYNAIRACRLTAEQGSNTTRVRVLLWLPSFCYRTLRSVGLRVSAAVCYMHAATGIYYKDFQNVVIQYYIICVCMIQYGMLYVLQFVLAPLP